MLVTSNDPVRLYLREMGVVPLLTREGEVAIAKRIERGQIKTQKAIARSPIAVGELLRIGEELAAPHSPGLAPIDRPLEARIHERAAGADGLGPADVVQLLREEQLDHAAGAVATAGLCPVGA